MSRRLGCERMTDEQYAKYLYLQHETWGRCKETADGVHEKRFVANLGRCYNQYRCSACGAQFNIDSGD